MSRKNRTQRKKNVRNQTTVPVPRGVLIPSQQRRQERAVFRFSGASVTNATTAGYSFFTIDSATFANASPWTALSNLYMFVRPLYAKITVTACRATSSSDNPIIGFAATPDGVPVGTTAMNVSTFEAPNCISKSLGPGQEVSYSFKPYVAIAAYQTPVNGYIPMVCPRVSTNSLPRIYFGDILLLTPGVTLTTSANYIQGRVEFVFEFDTIDNANVQ